MQAVFNITSDLMMLAVGLPLILRTKVEIKKYADPSEYLPPTDPFCARKIILVGIFSCGIFVVRLASSLQL